MALFTGQRDGATNDGTYAYTVECTMTTVKIFKGSNNAGASSNFAPTYAKELVIQVICEHTG